MMNTPMKIMIKIMIYDLFPDLEHEVRPPPALSRIGSHRRRLLPQVEIDKDHKES